MRKLNKVYNKKYVEKIVAKKWRYKDIPLLVDTVYKHFKFKSMIDFGCANGIHVKEFMKRGIDTFGIEGTKDFSKEIEKNYGGDYLIHDLRKPLDLDRNFDLGMSLEVLEHIEEEYADIAVQNICNHSNILCITASNIPKSGVHVNPQPKKYWIKKFESVKSFKFMKKETREMEKTCREYGNVMPTWMRNDLMIFRNITEK